MSLMDTIKGARDEAMANGTPFERGAKQEEAPEAEAEAKKGAVRRSAARAKPKREAAAGVRVVKSSGRTKTDYQPKSEAEKANMSKKELRAERRAERDAEREVEDRRYNLTQAYMEEDEEYKTIRKRWWIMLGAGVALIVLAYTLYGFVNREGAEANPALAILSLVAMVLAYVLTIGSLIYDWVKVRPIRQRIEQRVGSMSDKRVRSLLNQRAKEQAKEEKRSKKGR